ncbi:hypothetical protein CS542_10550 [Pedobacter sp. IW39]|nr:hypothetical protein CS542_10550 [Pedobacter sp. IW39]
MRHIIYPSSRNTPNVQEPQSFIIPVRNRLYGEQSNGSFRTLIPFGIVDRNCRYYVLFPGTYLLY